MECIKLVGRWSRNYQVRTTSKPELGPNDVLVQVMAAGLNFCNLPGSLFLLELPSGEYIPGDEAAGLVTEVGSQVNSIKVGQRVCCLRHFGLWAEYACVPANRCFPLPEEMSYEEAAALPINYVTAERMLFGHANLHSGQSVLVHMASGGVGVAATQLCQSITGVTVLGTASETKQNFLRTGLGIENCFDYTSDNYDQEILRDFPTGVDVVLDPLFGIHAKKGFRLLRPMGRIIHYGCATLICKASWNLLLVLKYIWHVWTYVNLQRLVLDNKVICGFNLAAVVEDKEVLHTCMAKILHLYREGKVKPKIDSVWSFEQIGEAVDRMASRRNKGKVILCPSTIIASKDKTA